MAEHRQDKRGAVCGTVGCVCKGTWKARRDPLPDPAVYEIKAGRSTWTRGAWPAPPVGGPTAAG